MIGPIRVVYERGFLRPLDPIEFAEGELVFVRILPETETPTAAPELAGDDVDEAALQRESAAIIEERREGP